MPEKITVVKESGESITSNIMSIFMVPENNKQYIITTENAVDPHGLTVLHVSEIKGDKIVKVQTDDEWATIKTIMRSIISGSVGSFKYIPVIATANAADQYSRDISVSAGAAKTLLESYTNGQKEVAITDDTTPNLDPNAISSDSIFPTAPVNADEDSEIAPGISEVENQVNIEPAITQPDLAVGSEEPVGSTDDTSTPVIPIVNNMVNTEEENNENNTEDASGNPEGGVTPVVDIVPPAEETPVTEENVAATENIPVETPAAEVQTDIASVPEGENVATPDVPEIPTIPAIPVVPEVPAVPETPVDANASVPEDVQPDDIVSQEQVGETPVPEATLPVVETAEASTEEVNVENPANIDITPTAEAEAPIPEAEANVAPEQPASVVATANIDSETVKNALSDVVSAKIQEVITEKADEIIPSAIENSIPKAIEGAVSSIQEPIEQRVEDSVNKVVEEKIQTTLKKAVEDTVNETIEKQSKALNSLGIKLDFGVESSFGKNASLDEIVAGAQELFVEGVKNLIMVMTERVYKELRIKEEELKKREIIVSQREAAVNDKTMAMMNGTYNPSTYTAPSVVPTVAAPPEPAPVPAAEPTATPEPTSPEVSEVPVTEPVAEPVVAPIPDAPVDIPVADPVVAPAPDPVVAPVADPVTPVVEAPANLPAPVTPVVEAPALLAVAEAVPAIPTDAPADSTTDTTPQA